MGAMIFHYLLVYILMQKKSLNRLAYIQKSEKHLPLISKGGMVGNFRNIKNGLIFKIGQYVLGAVFGFKFIIHS